MNSVKYNRTRLNLHLVRCSCEEHDFIINNNEQIIHENCANNVRLFTANDMILSTIIVYLSQCVNLGLKSLTISFNQITQSSSLGCSTNHSCPEIQTQIKIYLAIIICNVYFSDEFLFEAAQFHPDCDLVLKNLFSSLFLI